MLCGCTLRRTAIGETPFMFVSCEHSIHFAFFAPPTQILTSATTFLHTHLHNDRPFEDMKTVKVLHDVAYEGLRPSMSKEQEANAPDWLEFLMGKCWVNIPSESPHSQRFSVLSKRKCQRWSMRRKRRPKTAATHQEKEEPEKWKQTGARGSGLSLPQR